MDIKRTIITAILEEKEKDNTDKKLDDLIKEYKDTCEEYDNYVVDYRSLMTQPQTIDRDEDIDLYKEQAESKKEAIENLLQQIKLIKKDTKLKYEQAITVNIKEPKCDDAPHKGDAQ